MKTTTLHLVRGTLGTVLLAAPLVLASPLALRAAAQAPSKPPAAAPVKPAAIPAFQEATLANGLRILLVESKRQPVVSIALMLPAGDSHDPTGKDGLAGMAATLLTKGAGSRTADDVSTAIESVGGSIGAASGPDFLTLRANVLAENAPLAFELVGDAVMRPTFASGEVELARTRTLSSLQLEQSQPASLADRYFAANLYGSHPYGRRASSASTRAISVDDLRAFQRTRLVPTGALLVVAGDIPMTRVRQLAQASLGTWSGRAPAAVRRPAPPTRQRTEILLVHRPGSVQSNIVVGNLTVPPSDAAWYPLTVINKLLGGGTDSRLFTVLREQKSWTYGAYSSLSRNRDIGAVSATAEVRNAVTDSALVELLTLERTFATTPVSATELENGKGALVGSLPLTLETAQGLAEQVGRYTMLGMPRDFVRTLRPRLAAVTASQLQATARAHLRPDRSLVVVVGDGTQIYERLSKIAPVRIISAQGDAMQPSDLVARTSALPVDMSRLVARSDSFAVMVQGNAMGYQTTQLERTADGFAYRTNVVIGPIMQQTGETVFGADLTPKSSKLNGKVQGNALTLDATYAGGRVKGTRNIPGPQGSAAATIDTTVAAGVLDDNMLGALIPGLRWVPGAKYNATTFDATTGATRQLTVAVTGSETITVPAGTFPVYRVEVTGGAQPLALFVTQAAPHRVVKMAPSGIPIEMVLVK